MRLRQLTQRLFKITEKLAAKEIDADPKGFLARQAVELARSMRRGTVNLD